MTELQLYKFINENSIEYHWNKIYDKNQTNYREDVILYVDNYLVNEFQKLLGSHSMDEQGIKCWMKEGYFCFWMKDLCENADIDMENVFDREKEY